MGARTSAKRLLELKRRAPHLIRARYCHVSTSIRYPVQSCQYERGYADTPVSTRIARAFAPSGVSTSLASKICVAAYDHKYQVVYKYARMSIADLQHTAAQYRISRRTISAYHTSVLNNGSLPNVSSMHCVGRQRHTVGQYRTPRSTTGACGVGHTVGSSA
eukprot:3941994-Rhodomonas_salina.5